MTVSEQYLSDLDTQTRSQLKQGSYNSRLSFRSLSIPPTAISTDGSEWLHCVEAIKEKIENRHVMRLRVITNTHRGVTITIPIYGQDMNLKYLDLRFKIRNSDTVLVTFPDIFVTASRRVCNELYLRANDFKIYNPDTDYKPHYVPEI